MTSIFTEAQAPKVIRFDHAAVNAALMAAAKKRRHAQKHREAERRRAEKCPDDEPDVMTLMEGHPAKEETPDRLGFSVDEPDTIAMAEERLVEEPVDNDKADEQPLSPPPTLPFLKGPKKRRDAPMSRAEEAEAVTLAYAGDKEAQRKLVSCNEGLVRKKAGEFFANYQGFTFAELVEVGRCTIFDVIEARSYKPEKGYRFNTYAGRAVQNALWKYVNAPVADVGKTNPKEGPEPSTTAWPKNPAVKRKRRKPGKQEPKPGAPMSAEKVEALVDAFLAKGNTIKTIPPRAHKKRQGRIRPDLKGYISIPTERSRPVEDIGERLDLIMAQEHREGRS